MSNSRIRRRTDTAPDNISENRHPDSDILFNIAEYLKRRFKIPREWVKIEHTILIAGKHTKVLGQLTLEEISFIRGIVHTPDVTVVDGENKPILIVEQDGWSHESEERAEKDRRRNRHYERAGIPFIVMKSSVIKSKNVTPAEYLNSELERLGWHSPQVCGHLHLRRFLKSSAFYTMGAKCDMG